MVLGSSMPTNHKPCLCGAKQAGMKGQVNSDDLKQQINANKMFINANKMYMKSIIKCIISMCYVRKDVYSSVCVLCYVFSRPVCFSYFHFLRLLLIGYLACQLRLMR